MKQKRNTTSPATVGKFDEMSFWEKIREKAKDMGLAMVYKVLQLYYAMVDKDTPLQAKLVIAGALAYVVLPVDLIPDFIPILGFADDIAAIKVAYEAIKVSITPEIESQADNKLAEWFGEEEKSES